MIEDDRRKRSSLEKWTKGETAPLKNKWQSSNNFWNLLVLLCTSTFFLNDVHIIQYCEFLGKIKAAHWSKKCFNPFLLVLFSETMQSSHNRCDKIKISRKIDKVLTNNFWNLQDIVYANLLSKQCTYNPVLWFFGKISAAHWS